MKTKAAETGILFEWALRLVQTPEAANVPYLQPLVSAGKALDRWLQVTRTEDFCLPISACQELCDNSQRHLIHAREARIGMVPKHHFFSHLSQMAFLQGNPKMTACFTDESLNLVLRNLASATHRARQAERIFTHMRLIGSLKPHLPIAS